MRTSLPLDHGFTVALKQRVEAAREAIKVVEIIEALQQCALGHTIMDKDRIAAAKIVLAKAMPDLKAIEVTGADGAPLSVQIVRYGDDPTAK